MDESLHIYILSKARNQNFLKFITKIDVGNHRIQHSIGSEGKNFYHNIYLSERAFLIGNHGYSTSNSHNWAYSVEKDEILKQLRSMKPKKP